MIYALQNSKGERPIDLARDPLCRQALVRGVRACGASVHTAFMRLDAEVLLYDVSTIIMNIAQIFQWDFE